MKPNPDFDLAALVTELTKAAEADGDGVTVAELASALAWGEGRIRRRLAALKRAGRLEIVPRRIVTLNEREVTTIAYRLKREA